MNLPAMPGANSNGTKAAIVVAMEDTMGQNMRLAAAI